MEQQDKKSSVESVQTDKWFVGTSGWAFPAWVGVFYPDTLKASDLLPFYSHRFRTVEVNTTFYRFPPSPLVRGWMRKSPDEFIFSIKAPRYFTHLKRLKAQEPAFQERFADFLNKLAPLEAKLGPIFFQLPPNLGKNIELLETFLAFLPKSHRFVMEFRNIDWYEDSVYELLQKYGVGTAIVSAPGLPLVPVVTSSTVYYRLHGTSTWYNYHYSYDELKELALKAIRLGDDPTVKHVFIYFDNEVEGHAIENARSLNEILHTLSPSYQGSSGTEQS